MVYVGANDGMLHGFEADVTSGGKERLAYVPSKTFANLNQLTNKSYVHRYYVDGSPTVNDAFVNNSWKTVLVGALASGGRGLFALDVTNPAPADGTAATELASASKVLWEFNAEDDVGVGYVLGQPLIRKMPNNRWAAIVSGGYNNNEAGATKGDGKGYIFVIFLDGPTGNSGRTWQPGIDYIRLDTGTGNDTTPNAVAPPYTVDMNLDGKADVIYAGDLLGTLWKFDVSSTNPSLWTAATNRVALYKGDPTQPITAGVEAVIHPTSKGLILLFGTGKYLEPSDPVAAVVTPPAQPFKKQSFYGIWDKNDGKTVSLQTVVTSPATQLFQQTINVDPTGVFRYITGAGGATGPDWTKHLGWFMDFPNSAQFGERDVSTPLVVSRRLLFTTITPGTGACDGGGTSFLMIVNPSTGGGFTTAVLDVTGDGVLNSSDVVTTSGGGKFFASGMQTSGIITRPALFSGTGTRNDSTLLNNDNIGRVSGGNTSRVRNALWCNSQALCKNLKLGFGPDSGRATWREVVKK
jgi:type IV pilus assembly protein PilY1